MKIWKIECCGRCPKIGRVYDNEGSYNYCYMEKKSLSDINTFNTIPKWCPLPDCKGDDKVVDNN